MHDNSINRASEPGHEGPAMSNLPTLAAATDARPAAVETVQNRVLEVS